MRDTEIGDICHENIKNRPWETRLLFLSTDLSCAVTERPASCKLAVDASHNPLVGKLNFSMEKYLSAGLGKQQSSLCQDMLKCE
jgi:hypothetical protein